jgi:hypothetical protein
LPRSIADLGGMKKRQRKRGDAIVLGIAFSRDMPTRMVAVAERAGFRSVRGPTPGRGNVSQLVRLAVEQFLARYECVPDAENTNEARPDDG